MKKIALATCLVAMGAVTLAVPASADMVRKSVTYRGGPMHGCKTVRTVRRGFGGKRVVVRRICH